MDSLLGTIVFSQARETEKSFFDGLADRSAGPIPSGLGWPKVPIGIRRLLKNSGYVNEHSDSHSRSCRRARRNPWARSAHLIQHYVTANSGTAPTGGSFTYDSAAATNPFSNFTVNWTTITFDLTAQANQGPFNSGTSCVPSGAAGSFAVLQGLTSCGTPTWMLISSSTGTTLSFQVTGSGSSGNQLIGSGLGTTNQLLQGNFATTTAGTSTPEPNNVFTLGLGLAVMALALSHRRQRTFKQ